MKKKLLAVAAFALSLNSYAADDSAWMRYPALSPDGSLIAFSFKGDIFTVPANGGRALQITTHPSHDTRPVWSPDGKILAFASDRMGSMDIYVVDKEGGTPKRLTTHSGNETPITFKDNGHLLFQANILPSTEDMQFASGQFPQVYEVSTSGGRPIMFSSMPMEDISISADGKTLYFCAATPRTIATEFEQIRYNLCSVDFDPATGTIGSKVDTVVFAEGMGKSATFPRPSYDGRFLVYNIADYGNFPLYHKEADLWILDLETGESRPMSKANSDGTESHHSWSSNSRWMMFSSRRDDGLYSRPYFTHIDENGQESKAFMLPQKHPLHYYSYQNRSHNVPEFVTGPVDMDGISAEKMVTSKEKIQFGFRMSD